ncbi:MAG TPA: hypothetical protein EYN91_21075 [Candidatus Melainabacteria bacterium]|nr:hypothetical protein [Candidatus Melainabacteria bacterium]HIN65761.1 hypothetical protein [Candidatus Obscuribacterales bacterium]
MIRKSQRFLEHATMKKTFSSYRSILSLIIAMSNLSFPSVAHAQMAEGPQWTKTDDGEIYKAFDDELKRTVGKLKLGEHPSPYFVSFHGSESKYINVYGAFGALDRIDKGRGRSLSVDVRVGDYKFDNSGSASTFFYNPYEVYSTDTTMALENDYDSIRRALWLLCDRRYKRAIEELEKKKAVLHQKKVDNLPDSFVKTDPVVAVLPVSKQEVDSQRWAEIVRAVSKEFRASPGVVDCRVVYENRDYMRWFQNSEGSKNREQEFCSMLYMSATAQASDGMLVSDFALYAVKKDKDMPSREELLAVAKRLTDNVSKLAKAPLIEEYSGPILFEKQAAAEFFSQTVAPHLVMSSESAFERRNRRTESDLLGKRILPKFINISDNPLLDSFNGRPLKGGYIIDDEGVKAKPVSLVEHGTLKTLCSGRTPSRGIQESNGHFRDGKAKVSQLFITSDTSKTPEELRNQLIQLGKDAGLSHVMIARKIVNPSAASFDIETVNSILSSGRKEIDLTAPTLLYKVSVADGTETLVRGARFSGLTRRTWRDIDSVANDDDVYVTSNGFSTVGNTFNIVTPSILVSEVDILRNSHETDLPIVLIRPDLASPPVAIQKGSAKKEKTKQKKER